MWNSFPFWVKFVKNNFRESARSWICCSDPPVSFLRDYFWFISLRRNLNPFSPSCELNPLNCSTRLTFLLMAFMSFFFSSFLVLNSDNLPALLSPFKSLFSFMSQRVSRFVLSVKHVVTFLCFYLHFHFKHLVHFSFFILSAVS